MISRLLLYVEEDYILPLAVDPDGKIHKYAKDDDNRLWLYFNSSEHSVDYARIYRTNVVSKEYGYYGDVFRGIAKGMTAAIGGRDLPYFDLLRQSDALDSIRKFYLENTGDRSASIATSFIFAESLEMDCRKVFMENMAHNGFAPVSFSVSPSSVLVDYALMSRSPEASFGDHILVVTSAADTIRLSSAVFDGENWLTDGSCKVIEGVGDAPLKVALARYVVDEVDRNKGYLTSRESREREYVYQLDRIDEWLSIKRDSNGDFDILDFAYSFDPDVRYSCHVVGKFLDSVLEDAVRNTVGQINAYKESVVGNALALTILCGPAFDDEDFVTMVKHSLDNPVTLSVPTYLTPKAFSTYFRYYYDLDEDFSRYDVLVRAMEKSKAGMASWIASAGRIRRLWVQMRECVPQLLKAVEADGRNKDEMITLSDGRLSHSAFDDARSKLDIYPLPSEMTHMLKVESDSLLREKDDLQQVFASVQNVEGARMVTLQIEELRDKIVAAYDIMRQQQKEVETQKENIMFYESHYDDYLDMLRKFKRSNTLLDRRNMVAEMARITREELPALKLRTVDVNLKAELKVVKEGLFGMKKKKSVVISASVKNEETLPCDAILNVSTEQQIEANEGDHRCLAFVIPKGKSSFTEEIQLPDPHLDSKKMIYVNLFVAPKELDKRAINVETESGNNFVYVKQN
ncbi:MAG: hypothetical protein J6C35_08800 [Bacteroidales bacterium]|nr:hypothetical protein [Bacteroidales bacterium]